MTRDKMGFQMKRTLGTCQNSLQPSLNAYPRAGKG
jgi:hypothetical protein